MSDENTKYNVKKLKKRIAFTKKADFVIVIPFFHSLITGQSHSTYLHINFLQRAKLKRKMGIVIVMPMKTFNERIADVSFHLESLTAPEFSSDVQDAVEKKDKNLLLDVCKKAKIPAIYLGTVVSTLFNMSSEQPKWPDWI